MFCEKCGKKIHDDALFCPYCGASTQKFNISQKTNKISKKTNKNSGRIRKRRKNIGRIIAFALIVLIAVVAGGTAWKNYGWYLIAKRDWKEQSKMLDGGILYPMRDTTENMTFVLLNELANESGTNLTTLEEEFFFRTEEGLMAERHDRPIQSVSCKCTSNSEDSDEAERIFNNIICTVEAGKMTYLKVGNVSADYSYDEHNRIQEQAYHFKNEVSLIEQYQHDRNGHVTEHSYYKQETGKKKIILSRQEMSYDSHGNRTSLKEYRTKGDQDPDISSSAKYQYKGKKLIGAIVEKNNNGSKERYRAEYNKSGQVTKITGKSDSGSMTIEAKYDQNYPVSYHIVSNSDRTGKDDIQENMSYSDGYRSSLVMKDQLSEDSWQFYDVVYDKLGRVLRREESNNFGLLGYVHSEDYARDSA